MLSYPVLVVLDLRRYCMIRFEILLPPLLSSEFCASTIFFFDRHLCLCFVALIHSSSFVLILSFTQIELLYLLIFLVPILYFQISWN